MFLLALASARRRSYLPALSVAPGRCVFTRGNTQRQLVVSLLPEHGLLAKNQLPTQAPGWITVPGIAHLNLTEAERLLCPVRQLKLYIRDSERIRGPSAYVHALQSQHQGYHEEPHKPMDRGDCQESLHSSWSRVRPCDGTWGQSLSASWAYNCQVALLDILSAVFWRSSGVFQNSYLRDMACIADGMWTLGPVVVAQQVVDPGHLYPPP